MNTKMQIEALSLLRPIISEELNGTGSDWWEKFVLPHLSYWNYDRARRLGERYLPLMDLAESIRVIMGNWELLSDRYHLDRRYYGVFAHLRHARNGQAHLIAHIHPVWNDYDQSALAVVKHLCQELRSRNSKMN